MPKAKRTKEEILKDLEENPPEVKIGHPLGDLSGNSLDDDKRMDEKGNVVVDGQLWSQSHTGLWLSLLGTRGGLAPIGVISIAEEMTTVGGLNVALVTTFGKPQWTTETIGQAIEIPSDLGQDPSKREYMTAWILRPADNVRDIHLIRCGELVPRDSRRGRGRVRIVAHNGG
jgi:hypothetical protein